MEYSGWQTVHKGSLSVFFGDSSQKEGDIVPEAPASPDDGTWLPAAHCCCHCSYSSTTLALTPTRSRISPLFPNINHLRSARHGNPLQSHPVSVVLHSISIAPLEFYIKTLPEPSLLRTNLQPKGPSSPCRKKGGILFLGPDADDQ